MVSGEKNMCLQEWLPNPLLRKQLSKEKKKKKEKHSQDWQVAQLDHPCGWMKGRQIKATFGLAESFSLNFKELDENETLIPPLSLSKKFLQDG